MTSKCGRCSIMQAMIKNISDYAIVVLTGGSSGIGRSFADCFNRVNEKILICNLSRSEIALFSPRAQLLDLRCDLSDKQQVNAVVETLYTHFKEIPVAGKILLINNSGFGSYGPYNQADVDRELSMIDVNIKGLMHLTGLLLPELLKRGGGIINIASTAAFQPTPYMATYGASKAFVLNWSLALNQDLKGRGVHVLVVCPGPTKSNFFRNAGFSEAPLNPGMGQTAEQVVAEALRAYSRKRSMVVCGWQNRMLTRLMFCIPRRLQAVLARIVLKKMRLEQMK